eukprot:Platyproteum_vivax@DN7686_c3_g2_i8.p1
MLFSVITLAYLSFAAATKQWSVPDLVTYVAGSKVIDLGKHYQCKKGPASAWCQQAAYRPSTHFGPSAWVTIDSRPPQGTTKPTPPATTKPAPPATTKPAPPPTKKPAPPAATSPPPLPPSGNCPGTVPSAAPAWDRSQDHYNGGDFVSHRGQIWRAKWWVGGEPGVDSVWVSCGYELLGRVVVTVAGLSGVDSFKLVLNGKEYTIDKNGGNFTLGKGTHNVVVPAVVSIAEMQAFTGTASPRVINVTRKQDYNLSVVFTSKAIQSKALAVTVSFTNGVAPSPLPVATVTGNGYNRFYEIKAGANSISVPEYGTYRIAPSKYQIGEVKHTAKALTATDGQLVGGSAIEYKEAIVGRVIAGYLPNAWNTPVKISEAYTKGYNIAIPAFIIIHGSAPVKFFKN